MRRDVPIEKPPCSPVPELTLADLTEEQKRGLLADKWPENLTNSCKSSAATLAKFESLTKFGPLAKKGKKRAKNGKNGGGSSDLADSENHSRTTALSFKCPSCPKKPKCPGPIY